MSYFFIPIQLTSDNLESNIGLDSDADIYGSAWAGEWSATYAGGYATNDVVRKDITLYESQIDSNTNDPATGSTSETPTWINLGKINRYRMFDETVGANELYLNKSITSATDQIIATMSVSADDIVIFDCSCNLVSVEILDADDTTVWQEEHDLLENLRDIGSYSEYFFTVFPDSSGRDIAVHLGWGTSTSLTEKVRLTLSGVGAVSCGNCFIGKSVELGLTQWGISTGAIYYGNITTDTYGRTTHIPGVSAKTHDAKLYVPTGEETRIYRIVKNLLSKDAVFNFNNDTDYDHLITYGYIDHFSEPMEQLHMTVLNVEIVGRI